MKTSSAELGQYDAAAGTAGNWAPPAPVRNTIVYSVLIIGVVALVNYYFIYYVFQSQPNAAWMYAGAFLLLGLVYIFVFPKWLWHLWQKKFVWGTLYTVCLLAVCMGTLFIFLNNQEQVRLMAILAGSAFLLPYSLFACVYYFRGIRAAKHEPWFIPPDVEPDTRMSLLLNSIHFKIRIYINHADAAPTNFVITLPLKLKLSAVFIRFLYDKHDVIEMSDSNGYPYGWLFSVKRGWRKKMLNPELTLRENGIREDDVIVIERVTQP